MYVSLEWRNVAKFRAVSKMNQKLNMGFVGVSIGLQTQVVEYEIRKKPTIEVCPSSKPFWDPSAVFYFTSTIRSLS